MRDQPKRGVIAATIFISGCIAWSHVARGGEPSSVAASKRPLQYNRDIRPIMAENCFACHGPDSAARKAELRLDVRETAVDLGAIAPGDSASSTLIERIQSDDPELQMPPPSTKRRLTAEQIQTLSSWIDAGAEYEAHWAFQRLPKAIATPEDDPSDWAKSPIDQFIEKTLRTKGLKPSPIAPRGTWLRRVTFDLTGLPPTLHELDAFENDNSSDAYERVVDRLLAQPEFGERMTNLWLDAARYADTFGYQADREMHVWPWRDWCIKAFNNNLPYDQFITWQLAGDLLPNASADQRLATTFNRLHRQTNEGGSIAEEFRQASIADRVSTVGTAFLGLTLECARCHDHKFDPISQSEFYSLAAFFSDIDEFGLYSHFTETAPTPAMLLYGPEQEAKHHQLLANVDNLEQKLKATREVKKQQVESGELTPSASGASAAAATMPAAAASFSFEEVVPQGDYAPGIGHEGMSIEFGGDDAYACGDVGDFNRATPFSLAMWLHPTKHAPRQLVLHRSAAAEDAAFRGYSITLDSGKVAFALVHFWPGNALRIDSKQTLKENEWTHVAVTYDGSSRAAGMRIYINGRTADVDVVRDQLTRDFTYRGDWGDGGTASLALGARFRDVGFRGGAIDDLQIYNQCLTAREAEVLAGAERQPGREADFEHYLARCDADYQSAWDELTAARKSENDFASTVTQIMVMQTAKIPRATHVLKRGAYDAPGEEVQPNTPSTIYPFDRALRRDRLGLAEWMTSDEHPLTARVAVNRFWSYFFGRGLAPALGDLGSQQPPPLHPELLDWLARDFLDHGWDVKRLCKQIALSGAYRQSSIPEDPTLLSQDPDNALFARGPSHRLGAEQIRDNALDVSRLLVREVGGPSVFPYQPTGLWEEAGVSASYTPSHGAGLYRRSMYTFWRRTSPPPTMTAFDAVSREVCIAKREVTSTPLQSLVLLNDPQFVEAARVFAEQLLHDHSDANQQVASAFRSLTSRAPNERELAVLLEMLSEQESHFKEREAEALAFVSTGESKRDEAIWPAKHAALAVIVQALMNHDECVTKR